MRYMLSCFLLIVFLVATFFASFSWIIRHQSTWTPAEQTENMLSELFRELYDVASSDENLEISIEMIDEFLEKPKYKILKEIRVLDFKLREGELAWFSPNTKFSIGLHKDGRKLWIVDGNRTGESK